MKKYEVSYNTFGHTSLQLLENRWLIAWKIIFFHLIEEAIYSYFKVRLGGIWLGYDKLL